MLKKIKMLDAKGDTIVEVMVVLAVLGLAISVSYATANRSLLNTRQAEENAQATAFAQSQIEALRYLAPNAAADPSNDIFSQSGLFCIDTSNNVVPTSPHENDYSNFSGSNSYPASCTNSGLPYHMAVANCTPSNITDPAVTAICNGAQGTFVAQVMWPDVEGQGNDTVTLFYRVYQSVPQVTQAPGGGGGGSLSPVLTTSGCTGPVGVDWTGYACRSGDKVSVTVSGVNSGDTCTLKNDQGDGSGSTMVTLTASGTSCSGNFNFNKFGGNAQTDYLTAYVSDSGQTFNSNTVSLESWANTPIYDACSWPGPDHAYGGVDYSNWVYTINSDSCPSGTTPCTPGVNCPGVGSSPGTYGADVACATGSIYVYGSTWNGHNNNGIPCPPGTTQVSRAVVPPNISPVEQQYALKPDISKVVGWQRAIYAATG